MLERAHARSACQFDAGVGADRSRVARRPRACSTRWRSSASTSAVEVAARTAGCCRRRAPATARRAESRSRQQLRQRRRHRARRTSQRRARRDAEGVAASQRGVLRRWQVGWQAQTSAAVAAARGFLAPAHRLDAFARPAPGRDRPGRCRTAPASRRRRSWSRRRRRRGCRRRRSAGSIPAGACAACAAPRSTAPISGRPDRPPASPA